MTLLVILLVVAIAWGGLAHLIFPERFTLIEGVVQSAVATVIASTHSNKAYEAGVDDGVQLRKPKAE